MSGKDNNFVFIRLLKYFGPYKKLFILSFLLAMIINAAVLANPYILKLFIDDHLVPGRFDVKVFIGFGLAYFGVILCNSSLSYIQTLILTRIGQSITADIRKQLFSHIQKLRMSFFDRNSSGRLLTRITGDIDALDEVYSGILINLIRDFIMIVGIFIAMAAMNVQLTLITLFIFPVIVLIIVFYRKAARANFIRMKSFQARINGFLAENISGIKTVKIFRKEGAKLDEFNELNKNYFNTSLREVILNSLGRPLIDVVNGLCIAVLLAYSVEKIFSTNIDIGVLTAFIAYIKQFFTPINEIAEKYTSIQSAVVSSRRIFEILDNTGDLEDLDSGLNVDTLRGEIEFKNVYFTYTGERMILKNISFKINPGETVAIVGSTGSGKSTIINLIAGFYKINQGSILIDGRNIDDYSLKSLRRRISVVLQDVFLFVGTIKDNIRLGNPDITDNDIVEACRYVGADSFIEKLPGSYDEHVSERGKTFSSGQMQLISFARAIASKPSILVLDEATSHIDTQSEQLIQAAMNKITKGHTTIVIAHRLSTIRNADRILVIDDGELVESGNHEELMSINGKYRLFYERQLIKEDMSVKVEDL